MTLSPISNSSGMLIPIFRFSRNLISASQRLISTTSARACKAKTYESKPVPGSEEHLEPLKWAEKLFKLASIPDTPLNDPPMLHMICRLKRLKGCTCLERAILEKYGLGKGTFKHTWIPVKNTPAVNKELNLVKHLIKVQPVEFPQGIPNTETDLTKCFLRSNGKFYLHGHHISAHAESIEEDKKITAFDLPENESKAVEAASDIFSQKNSPKNTFLDRNFMLKKHNMDWHRQSLMKDMFKSSYKYKLNQDGQEYRYSKLWRLDNALKHSVASRKNPDGTYKNGQTFEADWNTYPWRSY